MIVLGSAVPRAARRLLFGMRCLRKAILRAAGTIALYEEAIAFATETQELRDQAGCHEPPLDWLPVLRASRPQCSKVIDGATRNRGSHNHEQNRRDDTRSQPTAARDWDS